MAASAHHGFDGRYSLEPHWLTGEVVSAYFGQPHSELTIRVPEGLALPEQQPDMDAAAGFLDVERLTLADDVAGTEVVIELPPTAQYSSLEDRIAVGDTINAIALRNCEPPHQFNVQWLQLPDGEIVARSGAMSYMVEAC